MQKTVVIHIGLHKTGSTYIQNLLKKNRAAFPSWMAVFNQADGTSRALHQACQGYQMGGQKNGDAATRRDAILAECSNILEKSPEETTTILISDEEISGVMPGRLGQFGMYPQLAEIAETLVEGFRPHDVRFVVYTREIHSWIKSVHNQAVKQHRLQMDFDDFKKAIPDPIALEPLIAALTEKVGAGKVTVLTYEDDVKEEHGLGSGLLRHAGLSETEILGLERVRFNSNESLPPKALELVRALNATDIESRQLKTVVQVLLKKSALFGDDEKIKGWPILPPRDVALKLDRVFYINLDTRTDRRKHMERILADCPVPVERISGVVLDKDPEELGIKMQRQRTGQRGPAGIWLAHKAVLKRALETEGDGAIALLEDDLWLTRNFWGKDLAVPGPLPENWDMIMLSPRLRTLKPLDGMYFAPVALQRPLQLKNLPFVASGAHFVIFRNRDTVRKVLDALEGAEVTDVDLFYVTDLITYGVSNPNVAAGGFGSDH